MHRRVSWKSVVFAIHPKAFILDISSSWCRFKSICTLYIVHTSTCLCDFHLALNFNVYRSTTRIFTSNNKSCGKRLLHVDWRGTIACRLYSLSRIHRSRFQWDWCHRHARPQQLPQWKDVDVEMLLSGGRAATPKACTDYADPDGMQSSSATAECPLATRIPAHQDSTKKESMKLWIYVDTNEIHIAKPHFSAGRATLI